MNDTVTFMPAPMRPLLAARPDAYTKLIDLSLWQRATDRNDIFDTNLIPEVIAGPLSGCRVVWIITQADPAQPAHEQDPLMPPGPLFGGNTCLRGPVWPGLPACRALAVQPGSGDQSGAVSYQMRIQSTSMAAGKTPPLAGSPPPGPPTARVNMGESQ